MIYFALKEKFISSSRSACGEIHSSRLSL